jgi:hypothetical protein
VNYKNKYGIAPLHKAAMGGFLSTVKVLVENGADINAQDFRGKSFLCKQVSSTIVGNTPLHFSVSSGAKQAQEVTEYLIQHGASKEIINVTGSKSMTNLLLTPQTSHVWTTA